MPVLLSFKMLENMCVKPFVAFVHTRAGDDTDLQRPSS
jgi:hypothetical protein